MEGAFVGGSVDPAVLAVSMRFAVLVVAPVDVAVVEGLKAVAVFYELIEIA